MILEMTTVVNKHNNSFDVYIGRGSKWGNPFSHKAGTRAKHIVSSREEAIAKYREWITQGEGRYLLRSLPELKDKVLGCFCSPLPCHGDVLAKLVNNLSD